ncbi:uroporphyrinogen-III C-methyltransferase [Paenibacillus sacheonensis]|uniref:Uroporphyrinogen-III C-methyltransferase n=1 Tax=Paenibacillus sacheonensis TaxID=742054 RepID=A0A7X4YKA9_9BACL|nr:uroporphyrinogen-III C-methyltransferase [Paenibacillus sacheonensis]MBM7563793.1 uroporphyrinogen III methyltransferase/synthase [Paenibacillus sacheonensis]NBC67857.1 uroporphyrinogen-III C-methyltransferase [Paenibacillus sacheonensis]
MIDLLTGKSKGKVYLVGAGPGDPKLITLRGMECIRACDVIVYDRLASPRLLRYLKPEAEKIYVGKLPDRHTMKQEDINQLLVDLALQGKIVTRLKGGDPTIFGRVGEEAELLVNNNIEFDIVPGITSAIAVPAYAGIPVTHRDLASSLSIITGHESPDKLDYSIQWDKVTLATGTLVFLMGVAKIGYIAEQLIKHGKPADTPVALIRWGTRVEQRTVTGTLETIEAIVQAANFKPPAVIVVGDVVLQREKLNWYERKPLFGTRVLVTRARAQSSELSEQIEELGGEACEFPVIETRPVSEPEAAAHIRSALQKAGEYDWLMFTSVNGVEYFFDWLKKLRIDIRQFHRAGIAAVGPKTAEALEKRGVIAGVLPVKFQAEDLLDSLADQLEPGQRVLLPRGDLAREVLPRELRARGLEPVEIDVYETIIAQEQDEETLDLLKNGGVHVITFASSSTVTNLLEVLRRMGVADPQSLLNGIDIACIGPVTAKTAAEAGLNVTIQPEEATIDKLVEAIAESRAAHRFELGGV